ncbi:GNAT family N-acetyltransferase [Candidatus Saccharibacteria bacterium]|nr:GNAT family N-acetyltransferase [Candidatus Saccharibacteria bacterium]
MIVKRVTEYSPELAQRVRELLIQLSRSGKDKGEVPEEWFVDIINSPWHDLLVALDDGGRVIGMASLSTMMGPGIRKNAYLEDFVVDSEARTGGVGSALWDEMLNWGREKGCKRMEFTCGNGREVAQAFYKKHGAEVYDTNFFRIDL